MAADVRYTQDRKEQTRRTIVDRASSLFRRDGIASVGVRRLMSDAGLTHGGFYAHFPTRAALVADAVQSALAETRASLADAVRTAPEGGELEAFICAYLNTRHRDRPDKGCAGAALAPEIARSDDAVKASFTRGIDAIVELLALQLPGQASDGERFDTAHSIFSMLMGALELSRTTTDDKRSRRILAEARKRALQLASTVG